MAVEPGELVVCPTPIGNLGDVTLRALDELRRADIAACEDTRRSRTLLTRHGVDLPLLSLTEHNEAARIPEPGRAASTRRADRPADDAGTPAAPIPARG